MSEILHSKVMHILMKRSANDPPLFEDEYQSGLQDVLDVLYKSKTIVTPRLTSTGVLGRAGRLTGEMIILAKSMPPTFLKALGGWLATCGGREVTVSIGDFTINVSTSADLEQVESACLMTDPLLSRIQIHQVTGQRTS